MRKRKYTHLQMLEGEILRMREAGRTQREIAEHYGLEKGQIKDFLKRYKRRQAKLQAGEVPKPKGRPRKEGQTPQQREKSELERLRMENKLLRDFLQSMERK